jgi:excinuclease ABC subunit C
MMYEVLLRRYQRAIEENDLPDLVLLDGGRGQLNVGQEVFKELLIKEVDLIGLAKERAIEGSPSSRVRKTEEKVFHPQYKEPLILGRNSSLLHLLDRIRDEAHRFAITHHKKVRQKATIKSILGEIPEIGKVREKELLKYFGSVEKVKEASLEDLARAPKMNEKLGRRVYDFFKKTEE